ncbi:MAG: hypothetical protein EPO24_07795 [Bacteroidetes bacterium]|nr:MAG: hypothetical protein EPO24_07795 [Bacteroidota bacterium]
MPVIDFDKVQVGECEVLYKIRATKSEETAHDTETGWITLGEIKDKIIFQGTPQTFVNASGRTVQFGMKIEVEQMPIEQFSDTAITDLDATQGEIVDILFKGLDGASKKVLACAVTYAPDGELSPMNPLGMKVGFNTIIARKLGDIVKNYAIAW